MLKTMLESAAYARMRALNPSEFVPRSVFFALAPDVDRRNSLRVKAALVYESITGRSINDGAKPVATSLLIRLADNCRYRINGDQPPKPKTSTAVSEKGLAVISGAGLLAGGGEQVLGGVDEPRKTAELAADDEGSDENKWVIDAIFLVVSFLPRLVKAAVGISRDAVDEWFKSRHLQDIVTDVIKMENQLPVSLLLNVVDHVEDAVRHVAASASSSATVGDDFKGLQVFLHRYKLGFTRDTFSNDVVRPFCWYYSPFFNKQLPAAVESVVGGDPEKAARTLLDFLHASVVPVPRPAMEKGTTGGESESRGKTPRMPTARELRRSGVRVGAGEDGRASVEFEEAAARLRLPALVYDFKLETVARNLLALEYKEQSKPVTRYFQMMNELVEEPVDAWILRRAGAVRGGGGVHELVKRIEGYPTYPSVFMAMDVQIEKVTQFHDKRMNFLVCYLTGYVSNCFGC